MVRNQSPRTPILEKSETGMLDAQAIEHIIGSCRLAVRDDGLYATDAEWAPRVTPEMLRETPYPVCAFRVDDQPRIDHVFLTHLPVHGATRAFPGFEKHLLAGAPKRPPRCTRRHTATVCRSCATMWGHADRRPASSSGRTCKRCGEAKPESELLGESATSLPATGPCPHGGAKLSADGMSPKCSAVPGRTSWTGTTLWSKGASSTWKSLPKGWHR